MTNVTAPLPSATRWPTRLLGSTATAPAASRGTTGIAPARSARLVTQLPQVCGVAAAELGVDALVEQRSHEDYDYQVARHSELDECGKATARSEGRHCQGVVDLHQGDDLQNGRPARRDRDETEGDQGEHGSLDVPITEAKRRDEQREPQREPYRTRGAHQRSNLSTHRPYLARAAHDYDQQHAEQRGASEQRPGGERVVRPLARSPAYAASTRA